MGNDEKQDEQGTQVAQIEVQDNRMSMRELLSAETTEQIQQIANEVLVCRAFIPDSIETPEQAAVAIRTGLEIGLQPMAALKTIYFVHNKAGMESKAMLALLRSRPDLGYYLWDDENCGPEKATIIMHVRTPEGEYAPQRYTFTMEDAHTSGVHGPMYKKWPEVMLRNRVAAIAMRSSFPDLLLGCSYTPDELGAPVYVEGGHVVVDEEALARGELDEGDLEKKSGAALVETGLADDAEDGVDFDAPGRDAQKLEEPPVDPEQARRDEIQTAVGTVLEDLLPPDDLPEWAHNQPDTIGQMAELMKQISPKMDGNMGRALATHAEADSHAETWELIVLWWTRGHLPAHVFTALCDFHEVAAEPNPFPQEESDPENEEIWGNDRDAHGGDDDE